MNLFPQKTLRSCLQVAGPKKELIIASLGCLVGTTLLLLAVQFYQDASNYLRENEGPKNYFTINKKIEGGVLVNLGKKDKSFSQEELSAIRQLEGVKRIGGFVRNKFPLTLYIWPAGKVGWGAAAKTDLFFESIPDEFLDFVPLDWDWEENESIVPIMVPKFYLDLWNFGLAPSRVEYPPLSTEAAKGMPIEIFIGNDKQTTLSGRFVAFSKRINSVLVPANFLEWANQKFGEPDNGDFYSLWKNGTITGPPLTRKDLLEMKEQPSFKSWEISPLGSPADRSSVETILELQSKTVQPSRIILEIAENPSPQLLKFIEDQDYELNREFPEQDLIKKVLRALVIGMVGIGGFLSLLSIATFASSFRLVVAKASEYARNLLLLGFSTHQISSVFFLRFMRMFLWILLFSLVSGYTLKYFLAKQVQQLGVHLEPGLSVLSVGSLIFYGVLFLAINKRVIRKSVEELR